MKLLNCHQSNIHRCIQKRSHLELPLSNFNMKRWWRRGLRLIKSTDRRQLLAIWKLSTAISQRSKIWSIFNLPTITSQIHLIKSQIPLLAKMIKKAQYWRSLTIHIQRMLRSRSIRPRHKEKQLCEVIVLWWLSKTLTTRSSTSWRMHGLPTIQLSWSTTQQASVLAKLRVQSPNLQTQGRLK